MLFTLKYQTINDAADPHSHFTRTIYLESDTEPARERVIELVARVSGGDFSTESVRIEEHRGGRDPEDLRRFKEQTKVYRL